MEDKERKEVESVIRKQLLAQEVVVCSMTGLDSGELHFSSDVQQVRLQLRNQDGTSTLLQLIVKVMPGQAQQIENNSKLGFKKEIAFYKHAVPTYIDVQEKHSLKVNNFPELFAATSEIIILSDLRSQEYSACQHRLDGEHTKLVLSELAKFHATGVALKLSNPEFFQSQLADVVTPALRNATNLNRAEINKSLRTEVLLLLKSMEGLDSMAEHVDVMIQTIDAQQLPPPSEPYATLLHNDLWRGNIMLNSSSSSVAFIDFQNTIYNSPARDLVYFLFTSVEKHVLFDFESIILFYHQHFVKCLSVFGCETSEFKFTKLMDEVNLYGPTKLKHMILLFKTLSTSTQHYQTSFKTHLKHICTLFKDREWL